MKCLICIISLLTTVLCFLFGMIAVVVTPCVLVKLYNAFRQQVTLKGRHICTSLYDVTTQKPKQPRTSNILRFQYCTTTFVVKSTFANATLRTVNSDYVLEALYEERCAFVGKRAI